MPSNPSRPEFKADALIVSQCVQSGFCCKKAPCQFGEWDPDAKQCRYLETNEKTPKYVTYKCQKYEAIQKIPGSEISPAFGAGCSSSLFNEDRDNIIRHKGHNSSPRPKNAR